MGSLRQRLRADTRVAHERLDALLAGAALSDSEDLAGFVAAQEAAFRALRPALSAAGDPALAAMAADLSARLAEDLSRLAGSPPVAAPEAPARLCPAALAYVLLGARLGSRAIARARAAEGRQPARLAFFEAAETPGDWRRLTDALSRRPATGTEADRTVADARAVFAVFEAAARAALRVPA